jgi:hypothetical protein
MELFIIIIIALVAIAVFGSLAYAAIQLRLPQGYIEERTLTGRSLALLDKNIAHIKTSQYATALVLAILEFIYNDREFEQLGFDDPNRPDNTTIRRSPKRQDPLNKANTDIYDLQVQEYGAHVEALRTWADTQWAKFKERFPGRTGKVLRCYAKRLIALKYGDDMFLQAFSPKYNLIGGDELDIAIRTTMVELQTCNTPHEIIGAVEASFIDEWDQTIENWIKAAVDAARARANALDPDTSKTE